MTIHHRILPVGVTALGFALAAAPIAHAAAPGPGLDVIPPQQQQGSATLSQVEGGTANTPTRNAPAAGAATGKNKQHSGDAAKKDTAKKENDTAKKKNAARTDTAVLLRPVSQILAHSPGIQAQKIEAASVVDRESYTPVDSISSSDAGDAGPSTASKASVGGLGLAAAGGASMATRRARRGRYIPRHRAS